MRNGLRTIAAVRGNNKSNGPEIYDKHLRSRGVHKSPFIDKYFS